MIKLDKDEKIILEVRKHWFVLFAETLFLIFLLLLPIFIMLAAESLHISKFIEINGDGIYLYIMATAIWLTLLWITFFVIWTDYYLDILIVTNKHIIDIEQKGLFSREISTFRLDRMQDITTEVNGLVATLLGFGNIQIQTAGESREFIAKGIPAPSNVRQRILSVYNDTVNKSGV